ncbi:MAG: hypothetical protein KDK90_02035 [Leptospiraceae bacterium]|nr:hypothetical protein [Leptospiraceae bacterium]
MNSKQLLCLRLIGSHSVTVVALEKPGLLGETGYRLLRVCPNVIGKCVSPA